MFVIKCKGRRGKADILWNVGGVARVLTVESAVELAFDVLAEQMRMAPVRTLWTEFGGAR